MKFKYTAVYINQHIFTSNYLMYNLSPTYYLYYIIPTVRVTRDKYIGSSCHDNACVMVTITYIWYYTMLCTDGCVYRYTNTYVRFRETAINPREMAESFDRSLQRVKKKKKNSTKHVFWPCTYALDVPFANSIRHKSLCSSCPVRLDISDGRVVIWKIIVRKRNFIKTFNSLCSFGR